MMWSTLLPSIPHAWHVCPSRFKIRCLILRHWLVLPLSLSALAISNTHDLDEMPTLCMAFDNELLCI
jgi:hypothetical protein